VKRALIEKCLRCCASQCKETGQTLLKHDADADGADDADDADADADLLCCQGRIKQEQERNSGLKRLKEACLLQLKSELFLLVHGWQCALHRRLPDPLFSHRNAMMGSRKASGVHE